jgi:hypothetical protein
MPGVLEAVILGTGFIFSWDSADTCRSLPRRLLDMHFALPLPSVEFLKTAADAFNYLSIAIPFGIQTNHRRYQHTEARVWPETITATRDIVRRRRCPR